MISEKEKCRQGELYDANNDAELIAERQACKLLCHEYNHLLPSETKRRNDIIIKLFGKTGRGFLDEAKVKFGDNVFIAPNCGFYTAGHPFDVEQRNRGLEYALPITIGDNVWIGAHVCVLPGVTIGNNCIIGAGSVVNKDIPEGSLAFGNPCRIIRKI